MSKPNLVNIDVDKLFEQHNVSEIDQVHRLLQTEVEGKKEEIRMMVGERYRDLLKAADTIALMKGTSTSVVQQIGNISVNCKSLNEKQLIGFKTESRDKTSEKQLKTYFGTTVQVKLLTILPEMIWTKLDENEFFIATQLFIFARHISTGLRLDVDNAFVSYFSVANKLWDVIEPFCFSIKQTVISVLEQETLTAERAADCLLSLLLLEKSKMDSLLTMFVQLRSKAYLNSLCNDQDKPRRVKDRILSSLQVLITTVDLVYQCFFLNSQSSSDGKGLVSAKLDEYSSSENSCAINLVDYYDKKELELLPDIIRNFRPSISYTTLSTPAITSSSNEWISSITEVANTQLRQLIELVTSMKIIQEIKQESLAIKKDSNWSQKCESFQLPTSIDFYKEKYQPLINDRIRDIIRQSWIKCTNQTFDQIKTSISEQKLSDFSEYDFLWNENPNDIPLSLKQVLNQDKKENRLLMKIKGFSPQIVSICTAFDLSLKEIFSETNVLLEEIDGKLEDKHSLLEFLKSISEDQISELITKIKGISFDKNIDTIAFVAKLLISFIELCPNLKLCLSYSYLSARTADWSSVNDKKNIEKWQRVCNLLDDESFQLWKLFCDLLFQEFLEKNSLSENLGYKTILKDFVSWETITIEEKDEQDNPVSSTIRIPSQPRISIHEFLFKLTNLLNQRIPQTLPTNVLRYLISQLVRHFLKHYEKLCNHEFSATNQNICLQFYFDLKFLQMIFVSRDEKNITEEFQKLTNTLKGFIDPFDFELFHSYLNGNIKKCIYRMQHQLGVLLPYPENLNLVTGDFKSSTNLQDKDPNILTLCSNASSPTWFPLLPVVMTENKQSSSVAEIEKTPTSKATRNVVDDKLQTAQQTAQNYASNVKSGAAAFFGAMSQDWFR